MEKKDFTISLGHPRLDVHSFQGLPTATDTRAIPHMVPLSYDDLAIGHRIQDALIRKLEMTSSAVITGTIAHVYYKCGILTLDCEIGGHHHSRVVLGPDNKATFMEYDLDDDGSKTVTLPKHMSCNDDERNLEDILAELKTFALSAQEQHL